MSQSSRLLAKKKWLIGAIISLALIAAIPGIAIGGAPSVQAAEDYVSISILAPPGTIYDWIRGAPVQTDNTNYEWSLGAPFVRMEVTACSEDITNTPNSYNFGTVTAGSTPDTTINYFEVTNNSGSAVNITVQGTDMLSSGAPNTIATASTYAMLSSTASGNQRKAFHANGLYWVFYSDWTNLVYKTSSSGTSWSSTTTVRACTNGAHFSIWFDDTYLHYTYHPGTYGASIYYRRGIPESDGTITWSTSEQTVLTATEVAYDGLSVAPDSNGYPFIGYERIEGSNVHPYITKSSTNDGTWSSATGFPYQLSTTTGDWVVEVIPLTSAKMFAGYYGNSKAVASRRWDGSAWSSQKTTTSVTEYRQVTIAAEGDDVHACYLKDVAYDILYSKYTYSSDSWGSETTVQPSVNQYSCPTLSIDTFTNDLYCFWLDSPTAGHVYYKRMASETWDTSPTDWIDESADGFSEDALLRAFDRSFDGKIALVYVTKTSSPYKLRFCLLGRWTLSDTATAGSDIVGIKAGLDDADDNFDVIVKRTASYNNLVTGLANDGTQAWGLQLLVPTSFSDGALKEGKVTLTATCD